jgi:hypothetical protein
VTLQRREASVPETVADVVPFLARSTLGWSLV